MKGLVSKSSQRKTASCFISVALVSLLISLALLSACGGNKPSATPTPTRTPKVEIPARPTATMMASPTIAASPTPVLSPTPTTDSSIMTKFPPDVNPLTGLQVSDPTVLERRPLAIKISNFPPQVRPQAGLGSADLVFEHYAEGGVTRFTAVFLGQDADKVGSIRSGRLIDLEIPAMYKAAFAYSGSSAGVKDRIRNSDFFPDRVISPDFGVGEPVFRRIPQEGKAFEHTLFASTSALWNLLTERGLNSRQDLHGLAFRQAPPEGGEPASYVEIAYLKGAASAEWTFDANSELYRRTILGTPHADELTGQQITAANVIVVYANHVDTDILEDQVGGGHYSIEIQIWTSGPVQIFRDGKVYNGSWVRQNREDMLSFLDANGDPLPLKPGNSWFQMVPLDFPLIIQP